MRAFFLSTLGLSLSLLAGCSLVLETATLPVSLASSSDTGLERGGPVTYKALWDGYTSPSGTYDGADLTRITLHELNFLPDQFYAKVPRDVRDWCPAFRQQTLQGRKAFYLGLISGIARYETDFRANVKYLEASGHYSRGLLQLGQLALSYYPQEYRCDASGDPRQLHDLQENISCGVMLISHWVNRDGYIAAPGNRGDGDARYFGAARYWSTLRDVGRGRDDIRAFTRRLPVCR